MAGGFMYRNQIRWYAPGGESDPVSKREFKALSKEGQGALGAKLKRLAKAEIGLQDLRHIRGELYEVRVQVGGNHYRAMLIQDSPVHYIILSCFFKNQRKTPKTELQKAEQRLKNWRNRN
ncbi:type II toxin-antitoxin system RelE/ParE family toxin [Corynebacterium riegelii]|uniref:type II toxin-antitoxin system RelE/ParE family toxin n=1 Tax=Corynebacterium riegelii TaxID=156976 RepID=UPI00288A96F6|nr:type II toxin-antitoxin system RelE/ParE family toxin [Corynebacterium riegelii]